MDRFVGKVAVVTGASSGIGAAVARKLTEEGLIVAALARRKSKLDDVAETLSPDAKARFHAIECDVSKEADLMESFDWIRRELGPVHVLINNAGTGRPRTLLNITGDEMRAIFDTNVLGLTLATRQAVTAMIANGIDGHVVHVNSITGHYVPRIPMNNVYPATKHAVSALTETLRQDLAAVGSKIKVSSISPGYVETEFMVRNGYADDERIAGLLKIVPRLTSDDVADAIVYVLKTPPHVQVTELTVRPVGEQA